MSIPFVNLEQLHAPLQPQLMAACERVLGSQHFIGGPEVTALERALAHLTHTSHAIGVSSGTDALLAALMALEVGPGDEVITTPFTFFATAGCIARTGATPVFADIDAQTFNLDPQAVARALSKKTRAIIPVHLFGQMADMSALKQVCEGLDVALIEDAAQAIGARDARGVHAGSAGDVGCFSFFPTKNLGGFGDGGVLTCHDEVLAARLRVVCRHGASPKYHHALIGGNFRLDALQAALLAIKLPHLHEWTAQRQQNAAHYDALLEDVRGVSLPVNRAGEGHVYHQYSVLVERRDEVRLRLAERGVATMVYYPEPLHTQPCFAALGYSPQELPVAMACASRILSLPVWPGMSAGQREEVASALRDALA